MMGDQMMLGLGEGIDAGELGLGLQLDIGVEGMGIDTQMMNMYEG
jgi:hypothetical protein